MPKKTTKKNEEIAKKLEYIGLDLENVPQNIKKVDNLEYRVHKFYDEKQYRQYKFIPIKDIQILLSPTNRLDSIDEKYKNARPLAEYLDNKNEENFIKHTTFLNMLKNVKIEDIEKIEEEQNKLNKKIPFKVKFEGNYLWQIYYSEATDKYFMIVPTEDSNYSTFFFLLKKQLEKKRTTKIFVPISNIEYSKTYFKKSEFEDIENYLWLFTKDWPLVYEVYDKSQKPSIQIVGETQVYDKIKSWYKIKIDTTSQANKFYKLLKAMFILQTELPHYYNFKTGIDKSGELEFYFKDYKMEYDKIPEWINEQYIKSIKSKSKISELINKQTEILEEQKLQSVTLEIEYLAKEKQITTFLECKKSFFGKFKYYFKYGKKKKNNKLNVEKNDNESSKTPPQKELKEEKIKENYTLEELIESYRKYANLEEQYKNLKSDTKALLLKNRNLNKKIENASLYIEQIDSHKKSIFEFWKYSNKDEVAVLPEGENEEVNVIKKIEKIFDYEADFEQLGKKQDKLQRKVLTKEETDAAYITSTDILNLINKIKNAEVLPKDIETSLKQLKKQEISENSLTENEEFNIFGSIVEDSTKVKLIDNKKHRELAKDKFTILDITKNTKTLGYKMALEQILEGVKTALEKVVVTEDVPIYKAIIEDKLNNNYLNIFNINPESEITNAIKTDKNKINFYKINLKEKNNALFFSNIIFYDNQNKTLPVGMNLSTNVLVDLSKNTLEQIDKSTFKIIDFENEKDDFSKVSIKNITVFECNIGNKSS